MGVYLTSLVPNPDLGADTRKFKQMSLIYKDKVKFMQIYKQILYIVGSKDTEENNDFSTKQITVM